MKKVLMLLSFACLWGASVQAYEYEDGIYYNPKKNKSNTTQAAKTTNTTYSNGSGSYIVDFSTMDVDEYNRRGDYYYTSPIDTIGQYVESAPDFQYTTQIQKYYNPTIVVDNSDLLQDVLNNSYGNIDIIYNYNGPTFSAWGPYYTWPYYSGWYVGYYSPWNWSFNFGPYGFGIGYNPWWSWGWNWGSSWVWRPSWAPRPPWGHHGPGPHPGIHRPGPMASYRPGGRAPFGGGFRAPSRRNGVGNYNPGNPGHANPGDARPAVRPQPNGNVGQPGRTPSTGVVNPSRPGGSSVRGGYNVHNGASTTTTPATRPATTNGNGNRGGYTVGGARNQGRSTGNQSTSTTRPSSTSKSSSSNTQRSSGSSRGGYSSGGGSRGGFGGGRSSGGGARGGRR